MTLKVTQGHRHCQYFFLLQMCSWWVKVSRPTRHKIDNFRDVLLNPSLGRDASSLHWFQHIITITVYVTACDPRKSAIFNKTVEITGQVCSLIHMYTYRVFHCNYVSILHSFRDIIIYFPKLKGSRDPQHTPFRGGNLSCMRQHSSMSICTPKGEVSRTQIPPFQRYDRGKILKWVTWPWPRPFMGSLYYT